MSTVNLPAAPVWRIRILYDGACPFCVREARFLKRRDQAGALDLEDIAAPDFDARRYGLEQSTVEGCIHGILPDGRRVRGMEVFRRGYAAVGLGWVLAPTGWPGLRFLCDRGYAWFARHRVSLGRMLGRDCAEGRCEL